MKRLPTSRRPIFWVTLLFATAVVALFQTGCGNSNAETKLHDGRLASPKENIPDPSREFRAAWVATVDNIDWPSKPDLEVNAQKSEAIKILDRLVELNMNAVIFQVRPQADALYKSKIEPWSYYLTGEQGKAPKPLYDPLEFWVEEAHKRGLQLHAWFNPYRANHKANRGPISKKSVVKTNPELVVKLGDEGYWWMDPSQPKAKQRTIDVVLDVVSRYDIDGVHFDDYFYPYPSYNKNKGFPDDASYANYQKKGGKKSLGDFRRNNVNQLIRELSSEIKKEKKHVEFGISPFGIWRPGYPKGVAGMDQYDVLYADARLWIHEGWVDYFMPQLYWPLSAKQQSFSDLLVWWREQNLENKHIWPGLTITKAGQQATATELVNQIKFTRSVSKNDSGVCLFSMKSLLNKDFAGAKALKSGPWATPALIPETSWIDNKAPLPPNADLIKNSKGDLLVRFSPTEKDVFQYILNEKKADRWQAPKIVPGIYRSYEMKAGVQAVSVRAVDRLRNISPAVIVDAAK